MKKLVILVCMLFSCVVADDFEEMVTLHKADDGRCMYRLIPSVDKLLSDRQLYKDYLTHIKYCLVAHNVWEQRYSFCVDCSSFDFMNNTDDIIFLHDFITLLYLKVIDGIEQRYKKILPQSVYTIKIILPKNLSNMISLQAIIDCDKYKNFVDVYIPKIHWNVILDPNLKVLKREGTSDKFLNRLQKVQNFFWNLCVGGWENIVVDVVNKNDVWQTNFFSALRLVFRKLKRELKRLGRDLAVIQLPDELRPKEGILPCVFRKGHQPMRGAKSCLEKQLLNLPHIKRSRALSKPCSISVLDVY